MNTLIIILIVAVLVAVKPTRRFALFMLPWALFGICYDAMRLYPNYRVNPIDVRGLYDLEKSLFGITVGTQCELAAYAEACKGSAQAILAAGKVIPSEFFALHHAPFMDILAGLFYLCWVPVPMGFSIYLFAKGGKCRKYGSRLAWAFLTVNLIGFVIYYVHPASPPWYAMHYGFTPVLGTPGNVGGLGRFDALLGLPVFHSIYGQNANVFAAIPSLHAAYMLVALFYAMKSGRSRLTCALFAVIMLGIWFTAVYAGHHYCIDVLLGILTGVVGITVFEKLIMRIPLMTRTCS